MSKVILKDSRVEEVELTQDSDYKYFVILKHGYHWQSYGTVIRGFHTVQDFLDARHGIADGKPPHGFD